MTTHINQRGFARTRFPQVNYNTPTTPDDGPPTTHVQFVPTDQSFADYAPNTKDNEGYATRSEWPTDQWIDRHDVSVTHTEEVCSQEIGRALLAALGAVETDQPAAGPSPTVYRSVFTPQDAATSRQLPAYGMVEQVADAHDVGYPSMVTERLVIKGDGTGRLTMDRTERGSGKRLDPSTVDWDDDVDPLDNAVDYFYNSQVTLVVNDGGGDIEYACRYDSFTLTIDNRLLADDGYRPGCATFQDDNDRASGMIRSECLFGSRMYDLDMTVRLAAGSAEYTALQQQKDLAIVLTAEGGIIEDAYTHKLTFTIPIARYQTVTLGNANGIMTLQLKAKVFFDVENDQILEAELINDVAAYTAA